MRCYLSLIILTLNVVFWKICQKEKLSLTQSNLNTLAGIIGQFAQIFMWIWKGPHHLSEVWRGHNSVRRPITYILPTHELSYQSTDPTTAPSNQPKPNKSFEYPPYQKSWESTLLLILSLFEIWILIFLEIFQKIIIVAARMLWYWERSLPIL